MRIVIEIDGDNVAVHTDRQLVDRDAASIGNAGSAPVELLREFGGMEVSAEIKGYDGSYEDRSGTYGSSAHEETALNPLRAGEAIARQRFGYPARLASESFETIDAGVAPKLPGSSEKKKKKKKESYGKE